VTLTRTQRIIAEQQALRRAPVVTPASPTRRFSVWCGSSIGQQHRTLYDLCVAAMALEPDGKWDEVEVLMKAGEGGSWIANYLHPRWGDAHPLALDGPETLARHVADVQGLGVRISPYIVVRRTGNVAGQDWTVPEQQQIRDCVRVAGRCVLNVEPGAPYDNGPKNPSAIRAYLSGIGVPPDTLEFCSIPRYTQVAELGGVDCLLAWTDPSLVGSASWETYDATAGFSGPTSLIPSEAIPRLDKWGVAAGPQYRICVVQRSRIDAWAQSIWCAQGMQVWFMDGD
jgi:hypothetical protein